MTTSAAEAEQHRQMAEDEAFLADAPLFLGLTPPQIRAVRAICRSVLVKSGQAIVREGESGDVMYILMEGRVEVSRTLTLRLAGGGLGESEKTFTRLDARDRVFLGEMALLQRGGERAATVVALTDCRLLEVGHDDFEALCGLDPLLGQIVYRNMARELSTRLRNTSQDVLKLTTALSLALGGR